MVFIAKTDFKYNPYMYTNDEKDKDKIISFKKGDKLPKELAERLKLKGPESYYEEGKEKPKEEDKKESIYTYTELKDKKKSEQVVILEDLGVGDIPRLESDRIKLIMELV